MRDPGRRAGIGGRGAASGAGSVPDPRTPIPPYSVLSDRIGSMRAARRAGRPLARSAVPSSTALTKDRTARSWALTPKSDSASSRASAVEASRPQRDAGRDHGDAVRDNAAEDVGRSRRRARRGCRSRACAASRGTWPRRTRRRSRAGTRATANTASIHESAARSAVDCRITSSIVRTRNNGISGSIRRSTSRSAGAIDVASRLAWMASVIVDRGSMCSGK